VVDRGHDNRGMSNEYETLIVAVIAVGATFAAASHIPFSSPRSEEFVMESVDTALERCVSFGIQKFADHGQWPKTIAGEDARSLIVSSCTVDVSVFGLDEVAALKR
jgi:hypothetical protein